MDIYEGVASDVKPNQSRLNEVYATLSNNPYFGAGAGLAGLGLLLSSLKKVSLISNAYFRRRFLLSLQINNEDAAYAWLLSFINKRSKRQSRQISVHTLITQAESGRTVTDFTFLPGHGLHYFVHNRRWIQVERQRERQTIQKNGYRTPLETVTLTTLGTDVQFLKNLLHQATAEALASVETGLVVYRAVGPEWRRFGSPMRKRPLSSVILGDGIAERIVNDLREFCVAGKWYTDRGIPYRRGYLFYGPPGSGKSSFISALASHFGYSICILSLSERALDDDRLNHLLNTSPPFSIVVLEDVDAAFVSREDPVQQSKMYEGLTRITFSGLLNAIDGVACADERILFMTTNHINRLDPALIRPGRVDVQQYFGYCTPTMFSKMYKHFYGKRVLEDQAQQFQKAAAFLNECVSPAQLQGYLLIRKENPQSAIDDISKIVNPDN